eukprot:4109502-Prymnesium_polylepis.1
MYETRRARTNHLGSSAQSHVPATDQTARISVVGRNEYVRCIPPVTVLERLPARAQAFACAAILCRAASASAASAFLRLSARFSSIESYPTPDPGHGEGEREILRFT